MRTLSHLLLVLTLAIGLTGCGTGDAPATTVGLHLTAEPPAEPELTEVKLGAELTLEVTSEIADVLHIHGYEKTLDVEPGTTKSLTFKADMAGQFEVETHGVSGVWMKLKVS